MSWREQPTLPGTKSRESHAHRGMGFEAMLNRAHVLYERTGHAKVEKIEVGFRQAGSETFRIKTPFDYYGTLAGGTALYFDAKSFDGGSAALSDLARKPHQLEALVAHERMGALAGLMIHSRQANRVYWLGALKARELADKARFAPKGRVKGVLKSLSVEWLGENATFLCEPTRDGMADYLPQLAEHWTKR